MKISCTFFIVLLLSFNCFAQSQFSGWLASFNSFRFDKKFSMHLDVQLRSSDAIEHVQTILIRPGLNYHINSVFTISAGYAWIPNRRTVNQISGYAAEHRSWEQLNVAYRMSRVYSSHRFRLEQRWIPSVTLENNELETAGRNSSHRFRYFTRHVLPIRNQPVFSKGVFAALQNEVFLNIANRQYANGHFYDQNRLYAAAGYRLKQLFDLEAGYMFQHIRNRTGSIDNHILQLALYKRL